MMGMRWSRDGRTLLRDTAAAAALFVCGLLPVAYVRSEDFFAWAATWSLLMCIGLAVRRVAPFWALAVVAAAGIGMVATMTAPVPALLAVPVVAYSVGRYHRSSLLPLVAILTAVGSTLGPLTWTGDLAVGFRFVATTVLGLLCFSLVALSYLFGRLLRERALTEALDREIATERFTAAQRQSAQADALVTGRARAEVAQELHDVLAHSLSVIVVQAEGARALTTKRPEAAVEALTVIADTGRRSIGEVRRIVSLLRGEGEVPDFGPAPTLRQIPELVAGAGDRITLEIEGETPLVPDSLGLAVFRVVQEAITNFLKHAGSTATAEVAVTYLPHEISVRVRDDGIGVLSKSDGLGSGVPGMRERVVAMGGEFKAGPRAGGGYEVKARLPMPSQLGKSWLRGAEE